MQLAGLEIPARAEFVSLARLVVSSIAADRYDLSDNQLDNLKLAVSEACVTMISEEGTESHDSGKITIDCDGGQDKLSILVSGKPGTTEAQVPLISSLIDEFVIKESPEGNLLRLTLFCQQSDDF